MDPLPAIDVVPRVRHLAETQREIYESGRLAFVSFVRAYREHQARAVDRISDVAVFIHFSLEEPGFGQVRVLASVLSPCEETSHAQRGDRLWTNTSSANA